MVKGVTNLWQELMECCANKIAWLRCRNDIHDFCMVIKSSHLLFIRVVLSETIIPRVFIKSYWNQGMQSCEYGFQNTSLDFIVLKQWWVFSLSGRARVNYMYICSTFVESSSIHIVIGWKVCWSHQSLYCKLSHEIIPGAADITFINSVSICEL